MSYIITSEVEIKIILDQRTVPPKIRCDVNPPAALSNAAVASILAQASSLYINQCEANLVAMTQEIAGLKRLLPNGGLTNDPS